jgi:hypothetical protein
MPVFLRALKLIKKRSPPAAKKMVKHWQLQKKLLLLRPIIIRSIGVSQLYFRLLFTALMVCPALGVPA